MNILKVTENNVFIKVSNEMSFNITLPRDNADVVLEHEEEILSNLDSNSNGADIQEVLLRIFKRLHPEDYI